MTRLAKRLPARLFLMASVSGAAWLSGCDFTEVRNPFNPPRPPQVVEGERRQPIYNQQMISRMNGAVLTPGADAGGIPPIPPEFGGEAPAAQDKGFFDGWFDDSEAAPTNQAGMTPPPAQPGMMPPQGTQMASRVQAAPAVVESPPMPAAPQVDDAMETERESPYPELGSVPPSPDEFETSRRRAPQVMEQIQQDHTQAQQSRAQVYSEPAQTGSQAPVVVPQPEPEPMPAPRAAVIEQPQVQSPVPLVKSQPEIAPAMQSESPMTPWDAASAPRRGVDIMTQEEWEAYRQRSSSAPAMSIPSSMPQPPAAPSLAPAPAAPVSSSPSSMDGIIVPPAEGPVTLPPPEDRSDLDVPATGMAAGAETGLQDAPQEDTSPMDWLKALVSKKEQRVEPAALAQQPAPIQPSANQQVLGKMTAPPLLPQQPAAVPSAVPDMPQQAVTMPSASPAPQVAEQTPNQMWDAGDSSVAEVIDARDKDDGLFSRLFGSDDDEPVKPKAPESLALAETPADVAPSAVTPQPQAPVAAAPAAPAPKVNRAVAERIARLKGEPAPAALAPQQVAAPAPAPQMPQPAPELSVQAQPEPAPVHAPATAASMPEAAPELSPPPQAAKADELPAASTPAVAQPMPAVIAPVLPSRAPVAPEMAAAAPAAPEASAPAPMAVAAPAPQPAPEVSAVPPQQFPAAPVVQAASAPKVNRAIAERIARLKGEPIQPPQAASAPPAASPMQAAAPAAPEAPAVIATMPTATHMTAPDVLGAPVSSEVLPPREQAAPAPQAPANPAAEASLAPAPSAPVTVQSQQSEPAPVASVAEQAPAVAGAAAPAALPSPKILKDIKMLPPSRYSSRVREGSKPE